MRTRRAFIVYLTFHTYSSIYSFCYLFVHSAYLIKLMDEDESKNTQIEYSLLDTMVAPPLLLVRSVSSSLCPILSIGRSV